MISFIWIIAYTVYYWTPLYPPNSLICHFHRKPIAEDERGYTVHVESNMSKAHTTDALWQEHTLWQRHTQVCWLAQPLRDATPCTCVGYIVCNMQVWTSEQCTCCFGSGTLLSASLHLSRMFIGSLRREGREPRWHQSQTCWNILHAAMWVCYMCVWMNMSRYHCGGVEEVPTSSLGPEGHQGKASACESVLPC